MILISCILQLYNRFLNCEREKEELRAGGKDAGLGIGGREDRCIQATAIWPEDLVCQSAAVTQGSRRQLPPFKTLQSAAIIVKTVILLSVITRLNVNSTGFLFQSDFPFRGSLSLHVHCGSMSLNFP